MIRLFDQDIEKRIAEEVDRRVAERLEKEKQWKCALGEPSIKALLNQMTEGLAIFDNDGNLVYMNPAALAIHGFDNADDLRKHIDKLAEIFELFDLQGNPLPFENWPIGRVLNGETIQLYAVKVRRKDTGQVWFASFDGAPIHDKNGRLLLTIVTMRDFTEHRKAEETLRKSEERLRIALDAAFLISFEWDIQRNEVHRLISNEPALKPTMDGKPGTFEDVVDSVHPEDRELFKNNVEAALNSEDGEYESEFRLVRLGGEIAWLYERGRVKRHADGCPVLLVGLSQDITKRKLAEEKLYESEQHLRMAQAAGGIGTFDWDIDKGVASCSPEYFRIMGAAPRKEGKVTFSEWQSWILPEDRDALIANIDKILALKEDFSEDYRIISEDGQTRWISFKGKCFPDVNGRPARVLGIVIDITERKQAEKAMAEAHALSETLLTQAPVGFVYFDRELRFVLINDRLAEINGLPVEAHIGKRVQDVLPMLAPTAEKIVAQILATGQPIKDQEFSGETALEPGVTRYWSESWYPVHDKRGAIVGFGAVVDEITERKQAEKALAAAHKQIQSIIDNSPDIVYAFDLEERFLLVNTAVANLFNSTPDQLIGKRRHEFMPKEDADWHEGNDRRVIETGRVIEFEEYSNLKNRSITWLTKKFPLRDNDDRIYALAGISADISERKQAEEELRRHSATLEVINKVLELGLGQETEEEMCKVCLGLVEEATGSTISFIGEIGPDGLLYDLAISNPAWDVCRMHDQTGHRKPPGSFIIRGIYVRVLKDGKGLIVNDPASHPDRMGLPEGHPPLTSFLGVPLLRQGKIVGMVAVGNREGGYRIDEQQVLEAIAPAILEALDRRRAEKEREQLIYQLEKAIKEMEGFTYSVSHDLRAPIRHLATYSHLLQKELGNSLSVKNYEYLNIINKSSVKLGILVDELLEFSRMNRIAINKSRVDVDSLVNDIISGFVEETADRRIDWKINPLPQVSGDPSMLRLVLSNLIGNAIKYTGRRPTAVIKIACESSADIDVIYVEDNGIGFDMKYYDKLFGVFQRLHTEEEFGGTGIGLANVQRIIERHGGRVWAVGNVDRGATFYFSLPRDKALALI